MNCKFTSSVSQSRFLTLKYYSGLKIYPIVCPGATDSRNIRAQGIPALGFSPIKNTTMRIHDHDEYLGAETYLKGIQIYKKILGNLAKV